MKFHKVYVELTNVCGLTCHFCPSKTLPTKQMSLEAFEALLLELAPYTKELALHLMGDPLTIKTLKNYLDVAEANNFKVHLVTSGFYMHLQNEETLFHPAVKQINLSLNAFNANQTTLSLDEYLKPIIDLAKRKVDLSLQSFFNLRLWNLDESMREQSFNSEVLSYCEEAFSVSLDIAEVYKTKPKSIRLASKVLLHFDDYFEWPSLQNPHYGTSGKCLGLSSHIGILADGRVVPCCLDGSGVINLGNVFETPLSNILQSPKAKSIREGFRDNRAVEELCQKCSYKVRFEV